MATKSWVSVVEDRLDWNALRRQMIAGALAGLSTRADYDGNWSLLVDHAIDLGTMVADRMKRIEPGDDRRYRLEAD